ncbi:class F sortase, partial [Streptomyces sp. SID3212]|nr:class F sortase [Streptomyces sp. SID3212]
MGQDHTVPESRKRSPWGVLALVMLSGIALMRNGVDTPLGPPQPAAAAAPAGQIDPAALAVTTSAVKP